MTRIMTPYSILQWEGIWKSMDNGMLLDSDEFANHPEAGSLDFAITEQEAAEWLLMGAKYNVALDRNDLFWETVDKWDKIACNLDPLSRLALEEQHAASKNDQD